MSARDSKYEVFRVRPGRGKDRDKDSDKRSSIHGTGGIIVKKHRESTTSRSIAPSDSASQLCDDTHSQASNDTFLPDSATSSPLLRTSSAVSLPSRTSPSSIQTPAALQPYLESETDELAGTVVEESLDENDTTDTGAIERSKEINYSTEGIDDSSTPKPKRRAQSDTKTKESHPKPPSGPEGKNSRARTCYRIDTHVMTRSLREPVPPIPDATCISPKQSKLWTTAAPSYASPSAAISPDLS